MQARIMLVACGVVLALAAHGRPAVASAPDSLDASPAQGNGLTVTRRQVTLHGKGRHVLRSGPGNGYAIASLQSGGATFRVIAKSADWYNVRVSDSETAWVHASLCRESDDLSDLEFKPNPRLYSRTGAFVLSGYSGAYAFDQKSNALVVGGRLGYYVFDRVVVEAGAGWTRIQRPAEIVESLFDVTLEAEDFHMLFYHFGVTYEVLPGRQMVPYISAGVGSSVMRGDTEPSLNLGAGTTLFLSRQVAMRWEVRDHRFATGSASARRRHDNIEFTLGTSVLF